MNEEPRRYDDLAPLQTFDPRVFKATQDATQDVCNFVLALALVFNDLRDLMNVNNLLMKKKPEGVFIKSKRWGAYAGIQTHLWRLLASLVNEFIVLIEKNKKVLEDPFFTSVIKQLSRKERDSWQDLVDICQKKRADTLVGAFIVKIRNGIGYHYEPRALFVGYECHFYRDGDALDRAFQSVGSRIADSRYYFADAATEAYSNRVVGGMNSDERMLKTVKIISDIAHPIMSIIHHFILKQGGAFQKFEEPLQQL